MLAPSAIEPEDVAEAVFRGIADERFLILPHPGTDAYYTARAGDTDRWIDGMNRVQRKLEERRGA